MELRDALALAREKLDDDAVQANGQRGSNLWSDKALIGFFREAQNEAAERARLIYDSETPAITSIDVVADQASYVLHWSIFDVRRVSYNDRDESLGFTTIERLDNGYLSDDYGLRRIGRWRNRKEGRGRQYFLTHTPREGIRLTLFPIPTEATYFDDSGTEQPLKILLNVYRYPVWPMRSPADRFELSPRYHDRLIDWVMFRCYEKRDSDTYRPEKAIDHEAKFTASFGPRIDADSQRAQFEARPVTNCGWGL